MEKVIDYDIKRTIEEIYCCYQNKCYLAALRMALMLPDGCVRIKNQNATKYDYIDFVNKYVANRFPTITLLNDPKASWGMIIYNLRCCLFHNNKIDICDKNYHYYSLDKFSLFVQEDENAPSEAMTFNHNRCCGDIEALKRMGFDPKNSLKIDINIKILIDQLCYGAMVYLNYIGLDFPRIKIKQI